MKKESSFASREYCEFGQTGPLPVGFFIPFNVARVAIKDFLESDGGISTRIQWVSADDVPPDTFPEP